jgi:hypothetical protein
MTTYLLASVNGDFNDALDTERCVFFNERVYDPIEDEPLVNLTRLIGIIGKATKESKLSKGACKLLFC